ncbi:MAG: nucleotidyltransferase domain-containing protein [Candidatus Bathyarchaeia archaeon]
MSSDDKTFMELKEHVHNPRTLAMRLKEMRGAGIVKRGVRGRYTLTEKGRRVGGLLIQAQGLLVERETEPPSTVRIPHTDYVPIIKRYLDLLRERYGESLRSVVLFGSIARGDWDRGSDIDLLIIVDGWKGKTWDRIRELLRLDKKLRGWRGYRSLVERGYRPRVQPYPLSTEEARDTQTVYFDLVLDGIILHDRDGFFTEILDGVRGELVKLNARRVQSPRGDYYWILKDGMRFGETIEI